MRGMVQCISESGYPFAAAGVFELCTGSSIHKLTIRHVCVL